MSASDIRLKARTALSKKYWLALLATFLASIFGATADSSSFNFDVDLGSIQEIFHIEMDNPAVASIMSVIFAIFIALFATSMIISLVRFVLCGVIEMGFSQFLLNLYDGKECNIKDLFSKFHEFGRGFLQSLLRGIYTLLWMLLFVIPGIVKTYSYALTPFIMAEDPNIKPNDAITLSRELMDGHKLDLFLLDLSFIGWHLLCLLTLGIGEIFLAPYINAAHAAFYREICPARKEPELILETPIQDTATEE